VHPNYGSTIKVAISSARPFRFLQHCTWFLFFSL